MAFCVGKQNSLAIISEKKVGAYGKSQWKGRPKFNSIDCFNDGIHRNAFFSPIDKP